MPFLACLPLIEADIDAVLALDQRCLGGLWTRSGYERELGSDCSDILVLVDSFTSEALQLRSAQPNEAHLAASDPTKPASHQPIRLLGIGCLWAILEEAHITTLAIEPAFQGQKLGQLLLTELLLHGHHRGLTRATLEVRASNDRALGLYQKFSFREAGQRRRYYSDGENARILWRSGLQENDFLAQIKKERGNAIAHLTKNHSHSFLPI